MLKQLNDLNFKWNKFIKMMLSLLAVREICDIVVMIKTYPKLLKQIRSQLWFSVISIEHIYFASDPFNFNKHVSLLCSDVWSNQSLKVCSSLFIMLNNNYMI